MELPRRPSTHPTDPDWWRDLKIWCAEVVDAMRVNELRGDNKTILVQNGIISALFTAAGVPWQFLPTSGPTTAGVGSVVVSAGYVNTARYGRKRWPASAASGTASVTGSGYCKLRCTKAAGVLDVLVEAAPPNLASTTHWEWSLGVVTFASGVTTVSFPNPGEKTIHVTL